MNDIFMSYRRQDASTIVGRLIDRLENSFGKERVFRDIESINYGQDFGEEIVQALSKCEVLLAIIGNKWVQIKDENGVRRLDKPDDWVRVEVSKALEQGVYVIPVLVEGAIMPSASELPEDIKSLARRNAAKVRNDPDFDIDIERLCAAIRKQLSNSNEESYKPKKKPVAIVTIVTLCVSLLLGVFQKNIKELLELNSSQKVTIATEENAAITRGFETTEASKATEENTAITRGFETTGASKFTASRYGLSPGINSSFEIARRHLKWLKSDMITKFDMVASRNDLPPALLAALASRETDMGSTMDSNGYTDNGNVYGVLAIDRRVWRLDTNGGPYSLGHINQGAEILKENFNRVKSKHPQWSIENQLQGAIVAYNAGLGNVLSISNIDIGTTGNDYSSDVLARAIFFAKTVEWNGDNSILLSIEE